MDHLAKINVLLAVALVLFSCREDEYDKPVTVKFVKSSALYSEASGSVKIEVQLDHKRNVDTRLHASWSAGDPSVFLNGDFDIGLDFTINAFSTQGYIQMTVFDDVQIDSDDQLIIRLTPPIDEKVKLASGQSASQFSVVIQNNDVPLNNVLQADLTWSRTNPADPINGVNWDFYLQRGVTIVNNEIVTIGTTFTSSTQPGGFETVKLKESDPDEAYYLVAYFQQSLVNEHVDYWVTLNGCGFINKTTSGRLGGEEVGTAIFIGPLQKAGRSIVLNGRMSDSNVTAIRASKELSKMFER